MQTETLLSRRSPLGHNLESISIAETTCSVKKVPRPAPRAPIEGLRRNYLIYWLVDPQTANAGLGSVAGSTTVRVGETTYRIAVTMPPSVSVILPLPSTE